MSKFFITLSLLFAGLVIYTPLHAQGETNYMPFFTGYGLKWNGISFIQDTCAVIPFQNQPRFYEGRTSICNPLGNLKYYTNGFYLVNSNHEVIDDGYLACLNDSCSSIQGSLFLPSEEFVHLFTVRQQYPQISFATEVFAHSIIDTSNEVIKKNICVLNKDISEALNAVRHANGRDWWVITAMNDTNISQGLKYNTAKVYLLNKDSLFFISENLLTGTDNLYPYLISFTFSNKGDKMYYSGTGVNGAMCLYSVNRNRFALDSIQNYSYQLYLPNNPVAFRPGYGMVFHWFV